MMLQTSDIHIALSTLSNNSESCVNFCLMVCSAQEAQDRQHLTLFWITNPDSNKGRKWCHHSAFYASSLSLDTCRQASLMGLPVIIIKLKYFYTDAHSFWNHNSPPFLSLSIALLCSCCTQIPLLPFHTAFALVPLYASISPACSRTHKVFKTKTQLVSCRLLAPLSFHLPRQSSLLFCLPRMFG